MNPENPDTTFFSSGIQRWRSREEIRREYLDRLSPEELRQVDSSYYWYKYGLPAWQRECARQRELARKYDPDQPRDDHGRWVDTERDENHTSDETGDLPVSFAAARRRGRSMAFCMSQYAVDGLMCNSVERSRQRACWAQAAERLGNCLRGRPIPPLNF